MNSLQSLLSGDEVLLWALNMAVHGSLIAACALAIARGLRRRAAMRYWVLCFGLMLVLSSPFLAAAAQRTGWSWLTLESQVATRGGERERETDPMLEVPLSTEPSVEDFDAFNVAVSTFPMEPTSDEMTALADLQSTSPLPPRVVLADPVGVVATVEPPVSASSNPKPSSRWHRIGSWLVAIWACVAVVLLLRVLVNWYRMWKILRNAKPIYSDELQSVHDVACQTTGWDRTLRPRPMLVTSSDVSGPIAAGIFRGKVVLPISLIGRVRPSQLGDVLVHEVAHVLRRDQVAVLFQNIASAVFWPHPLVRRLNRELAKAREEVCDNFVISATDAPNYSRTLLALAELVQRPQVMAGSVGFFTSKWRLEQRVAGLLDARRDRSTLLGRRGWTLVGVSTGLLAVMMCLGTITFASTSSDNEDAVDESALDASASDEGITKVTGVVRGVDDRPIPDAKVTVFRKFEQNVSWNAHHESLGETQTDAEGRYSIEVPNTAMRFSNGVYLEKKSLVVLATKHGYGPDEMVPGIAATLSDAERPPGHQRGDTDLRLVKVSDSIRGAIVDLEGRPIPGVRVTLEKLEESIASVDEWVEAAKSNPVQLTEEVMMAPISTNPVEFPVARFPTAKRLTAVATLGISTVTNEQGRFELDGLGADRLVTLKLESDHTQTTLIDIVEREMKPVNMPEMDPRWSLGKTYGREFHVALAPTQIIRGRVRDKVTGAPLEGVTVDLYQFADSLLSLDGFIEATTDAEGRYELVGIPKSAPSSSVSGRIRVRPGSQQPYFRSTHEVPIEAGLDAIGFDIELSPAIWATGKITDSVTGEPVPSLVAYHPYLTNPNAEDHESFDQGLRSMGYDEMYATDSDGNYRIPALPGRGILRVVAAEGFRYTIEPLPGRDGNKALDNDSSGGIGNQRLVYHVMLAGHAVRELNVAPDANGVSLSPKLKALETRTLVVQNPDGSEASGFFVAGRLPSMRPTASGRGVTYWSEEPATDSSVEIIIPDETPRPPVMFWDQQRKLGAMVSMQEVIDSGPQPLVVRLEPAARVVGKLVDADGQPLTAGTVTAGVGGVDGVVALHSTFTFKGGGPIRMGKTLQFPASHVAPLDDQGKFEYFLPPGSGYSLLLGFSVAEPLLLDAATLPAGETIDLGTVDVTADETKMPKEIEQSSTVDAAIGFVQAGSSGAEAKSSDADLHSIQGRVVDPMGRPVVAKLWIGGPERVSGWSRSRREVSWRQVGTSNENGEFTVTVPEPFLAAESERSAEHVLRVAATAEGWGFAWNDTHASSQDPLRLQLVPDLPISGRIVNVDGQPLPGVQLSVVSVREGRELPGSSEMISNAKFGSGVYTNWPAWLGGSPDVNPVVTDGDGRFVLAGLGRERSIRLEGFGGDAGAFRLRLVTRRAPPERPSGLISVRKGLAESSYFANFTHVAMPARSIRGQIRDQVTGKPVADVDAVVPSSWASRATPASTDKNGRFVIDGVPQASEYRIELSPNGKDFFRKTVVVPDVAESSRLETQVSLYRGLVARGRVVDRDSGKGIAATVRYNALSPNNEVDLLGDSVIANPLSSVSTDPDGYFEIRVLPGPGVIVAVVKEERYANAMVDAEQVREFFGATPIEARPDKSGEIRFFPTAAAGQSRGIMSLTGTHGLAFLNADSAGGPLEVTIELTPGKTRAGRVFDPDGRPLSGVEVVGIEPSGKSVSRRPLESNAFEVKGLLEGRTRRMLFMHRERNLGAFADVDGSDLSPFSVTLVPMGSGTVRFVDELGDPLTQVDVDEPSPDRPSISGIGFSRPRKTAMNEFRLDHLIAGVKYELRARVPGSRMAAFVRGGIQVDSGQSIDLGEFWLDEDRRFNRVTQVTAKDSDAERVIVGHVRGIDGTPKAGVAAALIAGRRDQRAAMKTATLAEAKSDANGEIRLRIPNLSKNDFFGAGLIASDDESAMFFQTVDLNNVPEDVDIRLRRAEPVRIRLLDLEGQPAAAQDVHWLAIMNRTEESSPSFGIGLTNLDPQPDAAPSVLRTDEQGWMTIPKLAPDQGALLNIPGGDRFAPQHLMINTGQPEKRPERDATYRPTIKNVPAGEVASIALAPSQPFAGRVLLGDGDQPASGARITIWASQQQFGGSMMTREGVTDTQGRFRLNPYAGVRYGIQAFPPEGSPHQSVRIRDLRWDSSERTSDMTIRLPKGAIVRGRVIDEETKLPIQNVFVQYLYDANNPNRNDGFVEGWQSMAKTDEEGKFRLAALPGRGHVVAHAEADSPYQVKQLGSRQIRLGEPGGSRFYAHAFEPVILGDEPNHPESETVISLTPSKPLVVNLRDASGQPVNDVIYTTPLKCWHTTLTYRAHSDSVTGARLSLAGVGPDTKGRIALWHSKRRIGVVTELSGNERDVTAVLKPAGSVEFRLIDPDGQPVVGRHCSLMLVMKDGRGRFDANSDPESLYADRDFIANFDRESFANDVRSDQDGRVVFENLIPEATYHFDYRLKEKSLSKSFTAKSNERLDVGELTINPLEEK
ncbi:MAG: M56 family metallopeptidase [Planctomycetota bacterium]